MVNVHTPSVPAATGRGAGQRSLQRLKFTRRAVGPPVDPAQAVPHMHCHARLSRRTLPPQAATSATALSAILVSPE